MKYKHLKSIASASTDPPAITSFDNNFDLIRINNSFEAAKFEPEPTFKMIINEIKDNHMKSITSAYMNISAITSSDEKIDPLSMNNSFEAAKFEPEPTFENISNEITDNHLKSITSVDMNVSDINSNNPYLYSEHIKPDIIPCILLQSP